MIKYPIVLILSEGNVPPKEIMNEIRKIPEEERRELLPTEPPSALNGYIFKLTTKYYETELFLVPFEEDITLLPAEIQENTEGVLIYFDSGKRSFSNRIPMYADFLKKNEIELGILLCDRLYDDSNEGITYKEAKQESKFLDVIELGRTRDEDEEEDPHDPLGYDELLQALRSFIWSNVQIDSSKNFGPKLAEILKGEETAPEKSDTTDRDSNETEEVTPSEQQQENSIEAELAVFEKLLTEVMMFKNTTSSWTRNERLAYAEKFADKFEQIIGNSGHLSSDED